MVAGQVPVQNISPLDKQQPRQRQSVAIAQGLLAITLAEPEVNLWDHTYKGSTISEHRLQQGRQLTPMTGGQHSSKGAQGITKEARWQGRLYPTAVGGFRFAFAAG
jgi:hypothetical protein